MRYVRALGFWGWVTLLLVYAVVGAAFSAPFHKNGVASAVAGNVAGLLGVWGYLRFWRYRFETAERRAAEAEESVWRHREGLDADDPQGDQAQDYQPRIGWH